MRAIPDILAILTLSVLAALLFPVFIEAIALTWTGAW